MVTTRRAPGEHPKVFDDRPWEKHCRGCGQPFAGSQAPTPIGWMHPPCAAVPLRPREAPDPAVLQRFLVRPWQLPIGPCLWVVGDEEIDVVGEYYRAAAFEQLCGPHREEGYELEKVALLVPELTNPHDEESLAVAIDGITVGHLPRHDRSWVRAVLHTMAVHRLPVACRARIVGGRILNVTELEDFNVILHLPDIAGLVQVILGLAHYVTVDEAGRRLAILQGGYALDVVGESEFQPALEELCGGRRPEGHEMPVVAVLEPHGARQIDVTVKGRQVGYFRRGPEVWRRIGRVMGRQHGAVLACSGLITGGKGGGGKGTRKSQFQVQLMLPSLPMILGDALL